MLSLTRNAFGKKTGIIFVLPDENKIYMRVAKIINKEDVVLSLMLPKYVSVEGELIQLGEISQNGVLMNRVQTRRTEHGYGDSDVTVLLSGDRTMSIRVAAILSDYQVRLAFDAPQEVKIYRDEVWERIQNEGLQN